VVGTALLNWHWHGTVSMVAGQDVTDASSQSPSQQLTDMATIDWTASADVAESNLRQLANSVAAHPYGRRDLGATDREHYTAPTIGLDPFSVSPNLSSTPGMAPSTPTAAAGRSRQISVDGGLGSPAPFSYLMDLEDYYYNELLMFPQ
jgi:hypothetical protein